MEKRSTDKPIIVGASFIAICLIGWAALTWWTSVQQPTAANCSACIGDPLLPQCQKSVCSVVVQGAPNR